MSDDPEFERKKLQVERGDRIAERNHDAHREDRKRRGEATVASGALVIRSLMLINGGAAVSVLAFIGGLVSQGRVGVPQLRDVADSLSWFAWGVVMAVASMGFTYLTNYAAAVALDRRKLTYEEPHVTIDPSASPWGTGAQACQALAIVGGIVSLAFFVLGMVEVRRSVGNLAPTTHFTGASPGWRLTIQTERLHTKDTAGAARP